MKENKGITLIVLVVTIFVLIIIAGVTISVSLNTGLIGKAKEAVNSLNEEVDNSTAQIEDYYTSMTQRTTY